MPEGPSIVILKEAVQSFEGRKIISVAGNSKLVIQRLTGERIISFKSWGKHFLICFKTFTIRIHLMLFGSYRINESKDSIPRLSLQFKDGELNFYACSLEFIEGDINETYEWSGDVMNDEWSPLKAKKKLKLHPEMMVSDALLDQHIFAGVGNIIKNEVLFRIRVHPESQVGALPAKQLTSLIKEARIYSFEFLEWKKAYVLRKHWLAYAKKVCPRDKVPFILKPTGKNPRRSFFCTECQILYQLPTKTIPSEPVKNTLKT